MLKLQGTVLLFDQALLDGDVFTKDTDFGSNLTSVPVYYPEPGEPTSGPVIGTANIEVLENRLHATVHIDMLEAQSQITMLMPYIGGDIGGAIASEPALVAYENEQVKAYPITALHLTVTPSDPNSKLRVVPE